MEDSKADSRHIRGGEALFFILALSHTERQRWRCREKLSSGSLHPFKKPSGAFTI